jgi:uncharacterized protein with HEPN domain
MQRDPRAYLWDARRAAELILGFVEHKDFREYVASPLLRSGVERQFEIIGEALNQLSRVDPDLAACVPDLAELVGFRNLLIHGYALVDDAIVWEAVTTELPALRQRLNELLAEN